MLVIFAFLCGLIFGVGLLISGMANPEKVLGFLDLSQPWDPSLAFVMIGAIAVGIVGFALVKGKKRAFCGVPIMLPANNAIDRTLVVGAILFGLGWGLAGICPGVVGRWSRERAAVYFGYAGGDVAGQQGSAIINLAADFNLPNLVWKP